MRFLTPLTLSLSLALSACSGKTEPVDDTDSTEDTSNDDTGTADSLYDQLGGAPAVEAVVTEFLGVVLADDRINWFFANADAANLSAKLQEQICAATAGPCTYTGGSMVDVHANMAITDDQFNALVEDLLTALDNLGVPYALDGTATIDPLLLALVGMQGDIVTDADGSEVYFNQLGGHAAVEAVIDGMVANIAADSRINGFFASTDLDKLKYLLVEQVCDATGGYCTYSGRDMCKTHDGMGVSDDDFNALVEDLLMALDDLGVPYTAGTFNGHLGADDLILTLAGMQGAVTGVACD